MPWNCYVINTNNTYPKSLVNMADKKWNVSKLKDFCKIETGTTPSKANLQYYGDAYPFYKPTDLNLGVDVRCSNDGLSEEGIKHARYVPPFSVLITCIGATIGKVGLIKKGGGFNQQINAIVANEYVNPYFVYYQASGGNFQKQIKDNASSTTLPIINKSKFENLEMILPPLQEQQAIVTKLEELFSKLDKGVESLKTLQEQLKVYRQAVLKWAFEGRLTNVNVKDRELPKGWRFGTIGEVCKGVEYGSAAKSKETGSIPVLRMGNIQKGRFDWNDLVYTDDEAEIKKYRLKKNDVLFNRTNSAELVGKTAIYKGERPAIFAGYLIRINRIDRLINADYLTYFLNSHTAKAHGNTVRSFGVNQSNINGTKLKEYPLPICSIEEQEKVVQEMESRLSICDKIEETITNGLIEAEALRQSILKQAFEGKLV